jgi:hypothetical protein
MQNAVSANEIRKWVSGYEGLYKISNLGFVYSYWSYPEGKKLSLGRRTKKPRQVKLWKNDDSKIFTVHSLVAQSFIGERPEGMVIKRVDGVYKNNHVDNLYYGKQGGTRVKTKKSRGKYKGVSKSTSKSKPFKARIWINGKDVNLGNFESEYHAARIHDRMWIKCG